MSIIETLKLRSKLFFLFVLVTFGLVSIGVMGTYAVGKMKKNIDTLYFGSLVPIMELNSMIQDYYGSIALTIYRTKFEETEPTHAVEKIEQSVKSIERLWMQYEGHYKTKEEIPYTEYASFEVRKVNTALQEVVQSLKEHPPGLLSIEGIDLKIEHIHQVLSKLLKYETETAQYKRGAFLEEYSSFIWQFIAILLSIIAVILLILYSVFVGIHKEQSFLQRAAQQLRSLNLKLQNASYTDSLTTLHNRRYFNMMYEQELKRAKREQHHITFMMLDIDYFKQYNDHYGHIKGDKALKLVAEVLQKTLRRPSDFLFRLGGEEFGVLLTQTPPNESAILANKICLEVQNANIEHALSEVGDFLTISVGVVSCIAHSDMDPDDILSCADTMLYKAKESGRNQYKLSEVVCEESLSVLL